MISFQNLKVFYRYTAMVSREFLIFLILYLKVDGNEAYAEVIAMLET